MTSGGRQSENAELRQICRQTAYDVGERVLRWRRAAHVGGGRDEVDAHRCGDRGRPDGRAADPRAPDDVRGRRRRGGARNRDGRPALRTAMARAGSGDGLEWVVDPIDGTTNFFYDFPGWAVSIAARRGGESVAAAVHVPTLATTFTAARGEGAHVEDAHGRRAAGGVQRHRAVAGADRDGVRLRRRVSVPCRVPIVGGLVSRVRDIRRAGAASVDLCAVAAGRVDALLRARPRGVGPRGGHR